MAHYTRFRNSRATAAGDACHYFPDVYEDTRSYEERTGGINDDGQFNMYQFDPKGDHEEEQFQRDIKQRRATTPQTLYSDELQHLRRITAVCRRCSATYTEMENFQWGCRYHPGIPTTVESHLYWSCCNRPCREDPSYGICGCKRCDHRSIATPYTAQDDQRIPCVLVDPHTIQVYDPAMVRVQQNHEDDTKSFYQVRRFEMGAHTI